MKPRRYTGTTDGPAQAKRLGTEQFVREVCELSGGALWNNGTWVVRNVRGKDVLSVHATGRAMDLSWRHLGDKGIANGRKQALQTIDYLVEHANFLRIEMVIDYFTQPHGRAWRCDRQAWQTYERPTVSGAPGGDWFHLEIAPMLADDPAGYKTRFDKLKAKQAL